MKKAMHEDVIDNQEDDKGQNYQYQGQTTDYLGGDNSAPQYREQQQQQQQLQQQQQFGGMNNNVYSNQGLNDYHGQPYTAQYDNNN